jgi:hypothetical protein
MTPAEWQRRYCEAKRAAGLCRSCKSPLAAGSVAFCEEHLLRHRENERRRTGNRAWRPGSPGRPPLEQRQVTKGTEVGP